MTKDKIIAYLHQALELNKLFESILFEGKNEALSELVEECGRMLYCDNHAINNDHCSWCIAFLQHQIADVKVIGDSFQSINKETILTMINELSYTPVYLHKPKLRIIANIENLKPDAANALLKFLEEPTDNTYFFLLTNDQNRVLPTILSRVKLLTLTIPKVDQKESNFLVDLIRNKNKENLLLLNNKLKKIEKTELQALIQTSSEQFLNVKDISIYEFFVELIADLKFSNNPNLAIDRFLIKVTEVI